MVANVNDEEKALDKIKKCLALAGSSNPHEAEAALRQARKLMDKYKLESADVAASAVDEKLIAAGRRPSQWMRMLASTCAQAFGCEIIVSRFLETTFNFIGIGNGPELSGYAYGVLSRQLQADRSKYVGEIKRCKLATKRRRGEIFAEAWVQAVYQLIADFAGADEEDVAAITAYKLKKYPKLDTKPMTPRKVTKRDSDAEWQGWQSGKSAKLHRAMGADKREALGHGG